MQKLGWKNYLTPLIWITVLAFNINNFFFWDTIQLGAKQASYFYDNNFSSFFLPQDINSGHPPFFGMLLAIWWIVFGKTLWASHLLIMCFIFGLIFQVHSLGKYLLDEKLAYLLPVILMLNPIFLGHSFLVSPDNVLMFLLVLAINSRIKQNNVQYTIACILLSLLSMRGMMLVFGLFLSEILYLKFRKEKVHFSIIYKYILSGLASSSFFIVHYLQNNWLGFHDDSPWMESFDIVSAGGYLYNLGLIGWRLLDFGNIFIVVPLIYMMYRFRNNLAGRKYLLLLSFLVGFSIVFIIPLAGFKYLTAHRYFMPLYFFLSMLFVKMVADTKLYRLGIVSVLLMFLGNWWVYPRNVSQGWDVSCAQLPFYQLTYDMHEYIKKEDLEPSKIGTEFPLKSDSKYLYLNDSFPSFKEADLLVDNYVLYSKVMNDFKEPEYKYLQQEFFLIHDLHKLNIDLQLYERRTKIKAGRAEQN